MKKSKNKQPWIDTFIGIGSNLGDRPRFISKAIQLLSLHPKVRLTKKSSLYESSPVGPKQKSFLNAVVKVKTTLDSVDLLRVLKKIEKELGRVKTIRWGPRHIDLDLIFHGDIILKTTRLTIPHPEYSKRKFVLKPLSEIAPYYKPSGEERNVKQIYRQLTDRRQKVKLYSRTFQKPSL